MLVWKLLKRHISAPQLLGFFVANLLGMLIVLLSLQFYCDVAPILGGDDSFTPSDYLVVSKQVKAGFGEQDGAFTADEIDDLRQQPFCSRLGVFTPSRYEVRAGLSIAGIASFSTDMFFEAVPDEFVDIDASKWKFTSETDEVPILLPRDYLALYNFGFAQTRSLPKLTPEVISMITINLRLRGTAGEQMLRGRVVGFGKRLNTILVPQSFIDWSNKRIAGSSDVRSTRLIMKVPNTADDAIASYLGSKQWETDDDKAQAGRMMFILRVVSGVVLSVGLLISALSFYILMLSIYLLVQKNTDKLQNLLLIGYAPARVCRPYQLLACSLNMFVAVLAVALMIMLRHLYLATLCTMFPDVEGASLAWSIILAIALLALVSLVNVVAIRRKIDSIPS